MNKILEKPIAYLRSHHKIDIAFLAVALMGFATITLFNVTNAAIWFDEAFSYYLIQFNFADIARYTSTDVHPPLYYWALKLWTMVFGTGEFGLRTMSIFFALLTIILTFFLVRKLFGRKAALVSLLFLSLSPMLIRYADEARMYTMSAFFVVSATYALVKANESKLRRWWVAYGILVALGMWTHYFTAFVWLAHWVWRVFVTYSKGVSPLIWFKRFFSKNWILAYVIAVLTFLPWVPFMFAQLKVVQVSGFWIGPVSVDTPTNYLTNVFYYLEHGQTQNWIALLLLTVLVFLVFLIPRVYKSLTKADKPQFALIASLAWAPLVLLFLASLPPLRSSFVERYLIPSTVFFMVFIAIVLVAGTKKWRPLFRAIPVLVIAGMLIFGITNVYKYGNYNKNTNAHIVTREVIKDIKTEGKPGEPIIASSPWTFYEAIPYTSAEHPVYFIDANTEYYFGSLNMLKDNDMHKIKDMDAFAKDHPVIWYLGQDESGGDIAPYEISWKKIQTVMYEDPLTGKSNFRATQYRI
jgi:mannosyltransferase